MAALVIVSALAGLTLTAALFLRGGLIAGCLAVLLAGACFGHPFFHIPLGPLPLTADRLLLGLLVVQYVVFRRLGWVEPKPIRYVDVTLFAFFAVLALSTFTHNWQIDRYQPVAELLFFFAMPAALYWVARQSPISKRAALWVCGSLAVFGVYLAITGIAEVREAWGLVFPKYIASTAQAEFLGRARGPFLNPVANGIVLCTCLCALLTWWPRVGRFGGRRTSNVQRPTSNVEPFKAPSPGLVRCWTLEVECSTFGLARVGQLMLLAVSALLLLGLYATLTRSVWIGAAASLLLFFALSLPRQVRYAFAGAVTLAAVLALAANWEHFMAFKRDRAVSAAEVAESAELRPILAVVAWNMFRERPLLGCGFGQYERVMIYHLADRSSGLPLEKARRYVQHNAFLALLTEVGLIGMTLFILLICQWARDAWRLWHNALCPLWARQMGLLFLALLASYLPNALFHDVLLMPMVTMLLFALAGMVQSLTVGTYRSSHR